MAQHDYIIANQSGAAFRSDLNNGLAAIVSQNSGAAQPSTTYAYQWWADTTTGALKIRNAANNAWIIIGTLADANLGLAPLASPTLTGTPAAPTASVGTNTTQLATTAFVLANNGGVPTGTVMLFQQSSAPTGWTKLTTHDNKALRVTSSTAGTGGSTAFTSVFTSRTPAGSVSGNNSGGGVNSHTLSWNEMPSHTHTRRQASGNGGGTTAAMRTLWADLSDSADTSIMQTSGSNWGHAHGFSQPSWSGSFSGAAMDFQVAYVDVILASKN